MEGQSDAEQEDQALNDMMAAAGFEEAVDLEEPLFPADAGPEVSPETKEQLPAEESQFCPEAENIEVFDDGTMQRKACSLLS